jgi:small subunit ribosomal protein S4
MKLYLKGDRCYMAKCAVEVGRTAPGMHGRHPKKMSEYGAQLHEKQRLRRHYGMQEAQFRLFFERASQKQGVMPGEALLQSLEMRLDNLVFRLGFALSRRAARQLVMHKHVSVNGRRADVPSMILKQGSVIQVKGNQRSQNAARRALETTAKRTISPWLVLDQENLKGEVLRVPTREEIAPFVNEQLVVELYSR